jgi:hypothetical protein
MNAATMKQTWANPVHGDSPIARNYVPKTVGLEAIAYYGEEMVGLVIPATPAKFAKHFRMGWDDRSIKGEIASTRGEGQ